MGCSREDGCAALGRVALRGSREGDVNTETVTRWMQACAESISEQRDYLTQLDAAIGDADHGGNIARGLTAVQAKLGRPQERTPAGRRPRQGGPAPASP